MSIDLGIDLGTANILIYVKGEGIVLNEPSIVVVDTNENKVIAMGNEAKEMIGKTPENIKVIKPLKDGVIADFEITEFFSGEDFINLIEKNENKKYFDIVFLDIYMNGITGIETAKKLRETDNQSKIIFITTSNEFASESYEVKAYDYLIKPFSKERILKTIERIFEDEKKNKKILDLPDGQIIPIDSLLYTTFSGHYVTIYLIDGNTEKF